MTVTSAATFSGQAMPATRETLSAFGDLIVQIGQAEVWSHLAHTRNTKRYAVRPGSGPGRRVEFVHSADISSVVDFDQPRSAHQHLLHTDGRGVTLTTSEGTPWRTIRVPDLVPGALDLF